MKKIGVVIFIAALAAGLILANVFSFGKVGSKVFNISFNKFEINVEIVIKLVIH